MADRQFLEQLTKQLANDGKLIESGYVAMRLHCMDRDAPPDQVREMRMAFMAGAQHLFSSLMVTLDPEHEPTEADMRRMDLIDKELRAFIPELNKWVAAHG
jgi:hypothetical protein